MKPHYVGQRIGAVPMNVTLERELVEWLAERAPRASCEAGTCRG
jgi:hypothetical protein